jgi:hypothetical protein
LESCIGIEIKERKSVSFSAHIFHCIAFMNNFSTEEYRLEEYVSGLK